MNLKRLLKAIGIALVSIVLAVGSFALVYITVELDNGAFLLFWCVSIFFLFVTYLYATMK